MSHALIVEESRHAGTELRDSLSRIGFASIDVARSRNSALQAAREHLPDLIIVGDPLRGVCPAELAETLAAGRTIPVILVSRRGASAVADLPAWVRAEGPYQLSDLGDVLETMEAEADPVPATADK